MSDIKFFSLGENALTVEFGNVISARLNARAINLFRYFERQPFAGLIEIVPAYASLTIFYDIVKVRQNFHDFETAFEAVRHLVATALALFDETDQEKPRLIRIPVDFSEKHALDLDFVAASNNLTKPRVVEIFCRRTYRVFMLGFMPAFAYMGEVEETIAAPRKNTPRLVVPKGSVGIAGRQTGIYPFDSPGGWQIIGKTDFRLFTPEDEVPCAIEAGDLVEFYDLHG